MSVVSVVLFALDMFVVFRVLVIFVVVVVLVMLKVVVMLVVQVGATRPEMHAVCFRFLFPLGLLGSSQKNKRRYVPRDACVCSW